MGAEHVLQARRLVARGTVGRSAVGSSTGLEIGQRDERADAQPEIVDTGARAVTEQAPERSGKARVVGFARHNSYAFSTLLLVALVIVSLIQDHGRFGLSDLCVEESASCLSGLVLQGKIKPTECPAFGNGCTPEHPLGATMVSSEGACAAYYCYRREAIAG